MRPTPAGESAIAVDVAGDEQAPAWYPWPELAGPLEQLAGECVNLANDVQRVIRDGQATIDALIAETEQGFQQLRQAHAVTRELTHDQAAQVLRGIRGKNKVGFQSRARQQAEEPQP